MQAALSASTSCGAACAAAQRRRSGGAASTSGRPAGAAAFLPTAATCRAGASRRRRPVAMAGRQTQLWDYEGSAVVPADLPHAQALQRRSFGHRNARTYLLVVADPRSEACRAVEAPLEELASGLSHERSVVVMALDASNADAARFASRILNVGTLPAVLVYPEGAPGCLAYQGADMTAEGLLRAINAARLKALPEARPYELRHRVAPLQRVSAEAGTLINPTPLASPTPSSYWGPGKVALWGGFIALSLLFWAWDKGLDERWEAWQLQRRLRQRRAGRPFTAAENLDDILNLLLTRGAKDTVAAEVAAKAGDQQLGWRRLGSQPVGGAAGAVGGFAASSAAGAGGGGLRRGPRSGEGDVVDVVASEPAAAPAQGSVGAGPRGSAPQQQQSVSSNGGEQQGR